jgi:hypothetical protein
MGRLCYSTKHPGRVMVPRTSGATKLSWCKEGMARVFAVMVQFLLRKGAVAVQGFLKAANLSLCRNLINGHWRSVAVQTVSESENCQGILDFD